MYTQKIYRIVLGVTVIFMLASCSRKKNNTNNIANLNDSLNEKLFPSKNEIKVQDRFLHPIDSVYLNNFKKGHFETIVNHWEKKHKFHTSFDSIEYNDFRMAIYYLSILESTHKADLEIILSNYDTSYYEYNDSIKRHVYSNNLYEQIGFYMLETLIVYDFMNYKRHDLFNQQLSFERFERMNENPRKELFYSFERVFIGHDCDNRFIDSVKTIYPYWSYIDTVKKYNHRVKKLMSK